MPAKKVASGVTAGPCEKCGSTNEFSQWQGDTNSWLSCSARDAAGNFCNGKPQAVTTVESRPAPSGGRTQVMADVFDRMADSFATLSALCVEASQACKGENDY